MNHATRRFFVKGGTTTTPLSLTALRIGLGIVMAVHGWAKLMDMSAWQGTVASLGLPAPTVSAWLATAAELLGGIGLVVGLLTPIAAFGVFATMLVAIFTVHLGHGLLAKNNGYELPLTIALLSAFFMARGAGPLSLDALIERWPARGRRRPSVDARPPMPSEAHPAPSV